MKRQAYERQGGICPFCEDEGIHGKVWDIDDMEGDHWIIPWNQGGKTESSNCMMLCRSHNRTKGGK